MKTSLFVFSLVFVFLFIPNAYAQTDSPPARTDNNLIVAAYNIQFFGDRKHDLKKLAKVIQHFDICGIIELHNEMEMPKLVKALEEETDKNWAFTFGVRTHRPNNSPANMKKARSELSDHLPVFAVFDVSGADDD